jgi:GntR family transcriptional regulator, transcriptional repressor for pyruvate dehydrogenase complex
MADRDAVPSGAIQHVPNLRSGLVEALIAQVESGELAPGQRLPTEQAIVAAAGVSRTVVREALASLRAKGLITTHQGLGAFVSNDPQPRSFSIVPNDLESIDEVLRVLELRIGVEVEAASFAALRRTDDDLERMAARLDALELSICNGGAGVEEDFGFHRAILVATRNSYFARLLDTLGSGMIPRQWVPLDRMAPPERKKYVARIQREHYAILSAIGNRNARAAGRQMRIHLSKSYARFVELRDRAGRIRS